MKSLKQILANAVSKGILEGIGAGPQKDFQDYPTDERATRLIQPTREPEDPISVF